ncbi:MAG: Ig-like domain-containing protein, partial [Candidatus Zixiibacteriota bacterium]
MNRNIRTKYLLNHWFSFFLLFSLLLITCGDDKPTGSNGDIIPPSVISTNPVDSASNVTIDNTIMVTFSEPVDSLTITPSTFFIDNNITGNYSFNGSSVTLTPSNFLVYATEYTATITTAVTDTAGNKLTKNYSWIFTTVEDPSITPPEVLSTDPANGALNVA